MMKLRLPCEVLSRKGPFSPLSHSNSLQAAGIDFFLSGFFSFFPVCSQMRSEVKLVLGGKKQLHSYPLFLLTFAGEL